MMMTAVTMMVHTITTGSPSWQCYCTNACIQNESNLGHKVRMECWGTGENLTLSSSLSLSLSLRFVPLELSRARVLLPRPQVEYFPFSCFHSVFPTYIFWYTGHRRTHTHSLWTYMFTGILFAPVQLWIKNVPICAACIGRYCTSFSSGKKGTEKKKKKQKSTTVLSYFWYLFSVLHLVTTAI